MFSPSGQRHKEVAALPYPAASATDDCRQEDERTEQGVEEQHRDNGVALQCLLLRHIIEAEEKGGEESEEEPHGVEKREKEKRLKIRD